MLRRRLVEKPLEPALEPGNDGRDAALLVEADLVNVGPCLSVSIAPPAGKSQKVTLTDANISLAAQAPGVAVTSATAEKRGGAARRKIADHVASAKVAGDAPSNRM